MYFYLDKKELIDNNGIRCLYTSNDPISELEKQEIIKYWEKKLNRKDISLIEFIGENLPNKLEYNAELNKVEEILPPIQPRNFAMQRKEKIEEDPFEEGEDGQLYHYFNKEIAIKYGRTETFGTFTRKLKDHDKYYGGKALLYVGDTLPYYITYLEEEGIIREATREEKYLRGQYKLEKNELFTDEGKIEQYDTIYQKIVENKIVNKSRIELIEDNVITLETEKAKARAEREKAFNALDLYDKAVLRGDIQESLEGKNSRDEFRQAWLDLPNTYTDLSIEIESLYPVLPSIIAYFA